VRLWILSDLHLELTRGWDLPSGDARLAFDLLVVAGDLIPRMERGVRWLRERVPDRPVIYVPGNHEFYGTDIQRTLEKAKAAAAGTNVHVLENETVRIGDVTFAGATLWTDFALSGDAHRAMVAAADRMNDYKKIRTAAYRVVALQSANPLTGGPPGIAEFPVLAHPRRQRVWALLQRACEEAVMADWVEL
jgi:predicted phosphodiesterase